MMWRLVEYYVQNEGLDYSNRITNNDDDDDDDEKKEFNNYNKNKKSINKFWKDLLENLSRILSEAEIKSIKPLKSDIKEEKLLE